MTIGTNYFYQTRSVADAIAEKDFAKAMSLRDPEFVETLDAFYATSRLDMQGRTPTDKVRDATCQA